MIVVSILLAFAIDAWWDQRRDEQDAIAQLSRVVAELRANIVILEDQDRSLNNSTASAKEFLALMGPEAEPVATQKFGSLVAGMFSQGTLTLSKSATHNFLSSGQLTEGHWIDIRLALSEMISDIQVAENSSTELREMRPDMLERMRAHVSTLDVAKQLSLMDDYAPSRFVSDPRRLLADLEFEGLVAVYAVNMEINRSYGQRLLADHRALIDLIESAR